MAVGCYAADKLGARMLGERRHDCIFKFPQNVGFLLAGHAVGIGILHPHGELEEPRKVALGDNRPEA